MNSESPFRISRIVLTVACILCGISAASYLAAQFAPRRNDVDHSKVAANAQQVNLSVFHPKLGQSTAQSQHPPVASRSPLLSSSKTTVKASASAIFLNAPIQTDVADRKNSVITARRDNVQTTSVERSVSPLESEGHSVALFSALVTFHPVTVNIDNADIIREISRVHERLDLLSAEAALAQSKATHHDAFVTAPFQGADAQPNESSSQKNIPAKLPVFEFSTGAFAIPAPQDVLATTTQNGVQFFAIADSEAHDPIVPIAAPVPVQWPVLPGVATLAVPSSQSAKRTTDPAFMNGRSRRVTAPPAQVANELIGATNELIGATHHVSQLTQAPGKHTAHSDCKRCTVCKQAGKPTYRIQRVTPSRAFLCIKSVLSH